MTSAVQSTGQPPGHRGHARSAGAGGAGGADVWATRLGVAATPSRHRRTAHPRPRTTASCSLAIGAPHQRCDLPLRCSATTRRRWFLQLRQRGHSGSMRLVGGAGGLLGDRQPLSRGGRVLGGGRGLLLRLGRRRSRPGRALLELVGPVGELMGVLAGHPRGLLLPIRHRLGPLQGPRGPARPPAASPQAPALPPAEPAPWPPDQPPAQVAAGPPPVPLPRPVRARRLWAGRTRPGPSRRRAAPARAPPEPPRPRSQPPARWPPATPGWRRWRHAPPAPVGSRRAGSAGRSPPADGHQRSAAHGGRWAGRPAPPAGRPGGRRRRPAARP